MTRDRPVLFALQTCHCISTRRASGVAAALRSRPSMVSRSISDRARRLRLSANQVAASRRSRGVSPDFIGRVRVVSNLTARISRPCAGGARKERFSRRVQMVFQDPYSSLDPRLRIGRTIAEPIRAYRMLNDPRLIRRRVDELLRSVGLTPEDAHRLPRDFLGWPAAAHRDCPRIGERAGFLICDEPTSALDMSVQARILNLLRDLQDQLGLTMLFISHNIATILQMADRVCRGAGRPHLRAKRFGCVVPRADLGLHEAAARLVAGLRYPCVICNQNPSTRWRTIREIRCLYPQCPRGHGPHPWDRCVSTTWDALRKPRRSLASMASGATDFITPRLATRSRNTNGPLGWSRSFPWPIARR